MSIVVRRLLKLLFTFGIYKKHFIVTYTGEVTSMNKVWSATSWHMRSAMKIKFAKIFTVLLHEAKVSEMSEMSVVMFYNSRVDVDNAIVGCKILMDCVKGAYLKDDSSKHYKALFMVHDPALPKNTYQYHLIGN
jgi:hypothetical protein